MLTKAFYDDILIQVDKMSDKKPFVNKLSDNLTGNKKEKVVDKSRKT